MSEVAPLISDLATILIIAGIITVIFKWLGQPVIVGYIVAGIMAGPSISLFPTVSDQANIKIWADIGVIFLLFAIGLDFSFRKLISVGASAIFSTVIIVCGMMFLGYTAGNAMGFSHTSCIFLGGMLSMSSTAIVFKAFSDMGLLDQKFTGIVLGILIIEDVVAVIMMVVLSTLAVGKHFEGFEMLESILKLAAFLIFWSALGIYLIPTLLKRLNRFISNEILLTTSLGLCLGMVMIATKAGFSAALGAFVMGSLLAETDKAEEIAHIVQPVKDLFASVFFVSVGMMIDPAMIWEYAVPVFILTALVLCGQVLFGSFGVLPGEKEKWYLENTPTENWKEHIVPSLWSNEELSGIDGVVWFTYQFSIPANCLGQDAELSLGTIDDDDITWVNGHEVGRTVGYDLKRLYKIPAEVLKEQNTITIKISDYRGGGGLYGPKDEVYLKINNRIFPLCDNWKYKVAVSSAQYDYVEYGPNAFPSLLFNAMIHPLVGLGMKGVIWYQGENNAARANEYIDLFPALIKDWRSRWNNEFPFYWVQLANFMSPAKQPSESHWANLRDTQSKTLALPHTGQAVIIDIGEENDIHPRNKQDVGKRLALHALHNDYGYNSIVCTGPIFQSVKRIGDALEITFNACDEQLVARNKYGYLSGFAIAGADGKYQWAQAKIENNKVIVWNKEIQQPVSVRYAWGDNPDDANLYNAAGLPASPFEGHISL